MGVGGPWRYGWGEVDDDDRSRHPARSRTRGNWVDTAAVYGLGHSEEVVGRALQPFRIGEEVFLFTKCGRRWEGRPTARSETTCGRIDPRGVRAKPPRLGVDRIDLYQAHWPDRDDGHAARGLLGHAGRLVDEGKSRWIGV